MAFRSVVLAAGLGTRMRSELPKVMHQVLGRPMVHYPIKLAVDAGCDEVALVVGYRADLVEAWTRQAWGNAPVSFHIQHEMKGTADAVRSAWPAYEDYDGDVLILYGDVPNVPASLIADLVRVKNNSAAPLALVTGIADDPAEYGRLTRSADGKADRIVEFKDANAAIRAIQEVNIGIYLVNAAFLRRGLETVSTDNAQGEFYLTDLVQMATEAGTPAEVVVSDNMEALHGVNNRADLARACALAREVRNREIMLSGVTMLDPSTTWIDVDASIEKDVTIEPGVVILGSTLIGAGAHIEAGVRLENASVDAGRRVQRT